MEIIKKIFQNVEPEGAEMLAIVPLVAGISQYFGAVGPFISPISSIAIGGFLAMEGAFKKGFSVPKGIRDWFHLATGIIGIGAIAIGLFGLFGSAAPAFVAMTAAYATIAVIAEFFVK